MSIVELSPGSFIYRLPGALAKEFCEAVVNQFEMSPDEQQVGQLGQAGDQDAAIKKTTDLRITAKEKWKSVDQTLFRSLADAISLMCQSHPYFASNSFKDTGYHIQRYQPGEYYHWHVDAGPGSFSQRQLVALWYLNDVVGVGGQTEFAFQNIKVTPKQGDLLLFPPFWTHVHRSVELSAGSKYIATTWVCFA
ncbi:MAG: hypothetical protein ACI9FD_003312 [Gammaproteobacteria bacterium]|jgi:hypothetical protein